jgi:hypothetical protein
MVLPITVAVLGRSFPSRLREIFTPLPWIPAMVLNGLRAIPFRADVFSCVTPLFAQTERLTAIIQNRVVNQHGMCESEK